MYSNLSRLAWVRSMCDVTKMSLLMACLAVGYILARTSGSWEQACIHESYMTGAPCSWAADAPAGASEEPLDFESCRLVESRTLGFHPDQ